MNPRLTSRLLCLDFPCLSMDPGLAMLFNSHSISSGAACISAYFCFQNLAFRSGGDRPPFSRLIAGSTYGRSETLIDTSAWLSSVNNTGPERDSGRSLCEHGLGSSRHWSLFFDYLFSMFCCFGAAFSHEKKRNLFGGMHSLSFSHLFFRHDPPALFRCISMSVAGIKLLSKEKLHGRDSIKV